MPTVIAAQRFPSLGRPVAVGIDEIAHGAAIEVPKRDEAPADVAAIP
jgi:hypothetical protein